MARELTYYDSGSRRRRNRKSFGNLGGQDSRRGKRRMSLPDWCMMIFSVVVAIGVAVSWAARWIDPASYGILSVAGLLVPALFIANFLCLLYWVIRWRTGVFIPLAVFVFGICSLSLFFRPQLLRDYGNTSRDRSLVSVVSYNVQGMMHGTGRSSLREVVSVVDSLRPDILCMQEFQSTRANPRGSFESALPAYHYKYVRYSVSGAASNLGWGNAIYSKFPIAASGYIDFEGTTNSIIWADIAIRRDTVRVFCAHLQTTAIKSSDEKYIVDLDFVGDDNGSSRVKRMVGTLTRGNIVRARQADSLAQKIASSPHPVIVCGDFNDTPVSYSYRKVARLLRDSFREAGRGYGYTYRGFFNCLRIDYVLHSPRMDCVEYSSPSFDNSDHNPVAVKIRLN